jgi:tetratricopeptide (TPR) repeat protein
VFATGHVARVLGLAPARIRAWARAGLVEPRRGRRGELRFSFQDLVLLRTARELVVARVPPARVRRTLQRLREQLPADRSLAAVRVEVDGERVVVRSGGARWCPESGQGLFTFGVDDVARAVTPLLMEAAAGVVAGVSGAEPPMSLTAKPAAASGASKSAGGAAAAARLYEWGCDLEDGAPAQARQAYRRALALDPGHYGANLNLGRLLHEDRDHAAAERRYRRALEARPGDAHALFNLGVALEDQGRWQEALDAYEASLAAEPDGVDAHHNAARLCEQLDRRAQALRHLGAFRRLRERDQ